MKRNIRTQLLVINTVALVVIFSTMSAYLINSSTNTLRSRLKGEARAFAALATPPVGDSFSVYGESGTSKVREAMSSYLQENATITNITVVDLQGNSLLAYNDMPVRVTAEQASSFTPTFVTSGGELEKVIYPYFGAAGAHSYSVVYTISSEATNTAIRHEAMSLLIFSLSSLIITSAVTFMAISYFILRPVRKVSRQAAIISSGNLEQQIVVAGNNEIAQLGRAVNAMAESLKANITKLQEIDKVKSEFMAITSHNLRTPLTIINGYLESIDILNDIEGLKKVIARIGASVTRLDSFAEDVLTISQFELGGKELVKEDVPIKDLMQKVADETAANAELHKLKFSADINTEASVSASKPHLKNAIYNIVDNAIKFTSEGGTVNLKVTDDGQLVHIAVNDTGIGIAKDEIPKLFTKFHRGTSVMKYDYEGTGIGLYASKIIVEDIGGTISVETEEGKGSTFTINLPVAAKPDSGHTVTKESTKDV